jgi:uncharacterized iron-regulated protein
MGLNCFPEGVSVIIRVRFLFEERKMGKTFRFLLGIAVSVLATVVSAADQQDILPLGASPLKYRLASLEAGKLMDTASGETIAPEAAIDRFLKATDVFVVGEYHDHYACHEFQRDFIAALADKYPRLVVGLEFFQRGDDNLLEQWRLGKISEDELIRKSGWYARSALNFGYTRLILEEIRKRNIKVIGLNVPRDILHRVSTRGWESLSTGEKKLFPTLAAANPDHEYFVRTTFGDLAVRVPLWFANVYNAQKCWDAVMAESMRSLLGRREFKGYKGVIIAGSGHVAYGLGIPFRYRLAEKKAKLVTVVPVKVGKKEEKTEEENPMMKALAAGMKPAAVFSRGIADLVLALAPEERTYFPTTGMSGKMTPAGYEVTGVDKGSAGEIWGIRAGDIVTAMDGVPFQTQEELRWRLALKKWDDPLQFDIRKQGVLR